jgi:hypothetical protein
MKQLFLCTLTLISVIHVSAQDAAPAAKPWKRGGVAGLNFSQTQLINWQGGGQSAINGTVLTNLYANYAQGAWTWDNMLDGAYGLARIGEVGELRKTDDRIEINSKLGRTTSVINTFWTAMFTFKTQWDAGYDYAKSPKALISDPFAPAYILVGTGIDYKPKPAFSLYISPVTNKTTIVDNQRLADAGAFGVEAAQFDATGVMTSAGQRIRYEVGGYVKVQFTKDLMENVKLTTKADLFSNYLHNPQNIDVNWESLITMKINKFLSTSLITNLIYDDDIRIAIDKDKDGVFEKTGPRTQFKEVFSLGIQYQFNGK